jgi:hypothetical protein
MRAYRLASLAAVLALSPSLVLAEGPDYSFLEAGYVTTNVDNFNTDIDGFVLRGSFEFTDNWFGYGRYLDQSTDIAGTTIDVAQWSIGAGYAWPVNDATDIYGKAGYVEADAEVDAFNAHASDNGYELSVGMRGFAMEQFEYEGAVNYTDLSDSGDTTSVGIAARWYFMPQFAVGLEGEFGEDANSYGLGARWKFSAN